MAAWSDCSLAWYLNLQLFRPLRYGIDLLPGDGLAQSTWIAASLSLLITVGLLLKSRLPLAVAAHLALSYSALILYSGGIIAPLASTLALTVGPRVWTDPNRLVTGILLLSLMSTILSHREYWREIFAPKGQ